MRTVTIKNVECITSKQFKSLMNIDRCYLGRLVKDQWINPIYVYPNHITLKDCYVSVEELYRLGIDVYKVYLSISEILDWAEDLGMDLKYKTFYSTVVAKNIVGRVQFYKGGISWFSEQEVIEFFRCRKIKIKSRRRKC